MILTRTHSLKTKFSHFKKSEKLHRSSKKKVHTNLRRNDEIESLKQKLEEKGTSYGEHVVTQTQRDTPVGKCPFLGSHPLLKRTAERESNARSYSRRFPIAVAKAQGSVIEDDEGNVYLDALAGAGTLNIGHNHPDVVEAAIKHLESGAAMQLLDLSSPAKDNFLNELTQVLPQSFRQGAHKNSFAGNGKEDNAGVKFQFTSPAGTDVTECAMKLARMATGRTGIISFSGGYHGYTMGALACMGNLGVKSHPAIQGSLPGNVQFLPYPYGYRCPFGIGQDGHKFISNYIENFLDDVESGVPKPAAIILEAIQGEGGVVDAPPEFMQRLREACYKHGIVLILDEIQTGFSRTGDMFAFEQSGIVPDIICMSKSVGGGMPLGLLSYRGDLDQWGAGSHAGTFRGNQIALATGAAALKFTRENDLPAQAKKKGDYIAARLRKLQESCSIIGDIRGRGLMMGVEIVDPTQSPDSIGSYPGSSTLAASVQIECFLNRMLMERGGRNGAVMRFLCPVVTPDDQIEQMTDIFCESIKKAQHSIKN